MYRFFDYIASCDDCGWRLASVNALGVAAQHTDRHGHTVHVEVGGSVTYTPEGSEYALRYPGRKR